MSSPVDGGTFVDSKIRHLVLAFLRRYSRFPLVACSAFLKSFATKAEEGSLTEKMI